MTAIPLPSYTALADKIETFLTNYGQKTQEGDWNGPDSDQMDCAILLLRQGIKPKVWSEWGSGCYSPYTSKEGRETHDQIMAELQKLPETIYAAILQAGIAHTNHESDLYAKDCPETQAILNAFPDKKEIAKPFMHQGTQERWIDIPFAYLPWWAAREKQED